MESSSSSSSSSFDCNICLDYVTEPVVTFCGHLFCWSCIYKWTSMSSLCPVCKSPVSHSTVVPLYGRCADQKSKSKPTRVERVVVPPRPTGRPGMRRRVVYSDGGIEYGVLGEIVYERVFGNPDRLYGYPNMPYRFMRWYDKCLSRVFLFLVCCVLLCLFLF